jgi:hypothetical protein
VQRRGDAMRRRQVAQLFGAVQRLAHVALLAFREYSIMRCIKT